MILNKLLLSLTFIFSWNLFPAISSKGLGSQISFGPNSQLQANTTMSGLSKTVLFPANSNFQLSNSNPSASIGGITSSTITFGQDNVVELTNDASIGQSDQTWVFPNSATIDGKNHTLTILAPEGITVSGSATLTITNARVICGARQAISCNSDTATILLDKTTLSLGSEGLFWSQGNLTIGSDACIEGQDKSFFPTPSQSEFTTQLTTLGFAATTQHENSALYTMDFSGPTDDRSGITMTLIDKTGAAYYSDDNSVTTRTWHQVTAGANPYVSISTGSDGTIWLADNAGLVYVYRVHKDTTPALVQAQNITANFVSVGNRFNVYVLNTTSGNVHKCSDPDRGFLNNPLTGAPQTWVLVPNIKATSIAAGYDGSLWYVNPSGQVILRDPYNNETLVHDGAGHTFVKVSAKGSATHNSVALTCLASNRAYISHDNGPFKDVGLANVVEASTDAEGNVMMIFDNSIISEDPTYGAPVYYRHSFAEKPVLAMDRTLNFSASNGANLTIASGGTLALGEGTTLRMSADSGALETAYNARRHLVFTDNSSTLLLNRANIEAVSAGLTLTSGTVIIEGICGLFSSSWPGCQTEISSKVHLKIHSSSNLQTYGRVDYCSETRLYNLPTPTTNTATNPAFTNLAGYFLDVNSLLSHGFARAPFQEPAGNGGAAVAYNSSATQLKVFAVFSNTNQNIYQQARYYLTGIDPASIVPALINFQDLGAGSFNGSYDGSLDLGDDNSTIYTHGINGSVQVYVNGSVINNGTASSTHSLDVSMKDGSNYAIDQSDGTLLWYKPSGNLTFTNLGQRSISVTADALWYVNNVGEIWYIPVSNTSLNIRYTGARGLDIVRICVRGTLDNYKIMACDRQTKIYSADTLRPLEFENIYKILNYYQSGTASQSNELVPFSITTTGFASVNYAYTGTYFGYIKGCKPSSWCDAPNSMTYYSQLWPYTTAKFLSSSALTSKGLTSPLYGADLTSNINLRARRIGNQIELRYGYRDAMAIQLFNQDLTYSANAIYAPLDPVTNTTVGFMAGGTDGSYVTITAPGYPYSGNYEMYYVDPSGNRTLILTVAASNSTRNFEFYDNGLFKVAMNDANSVYLIRSAVGKLQKWAGGTNWTDVYTDYSGMPTTLSPSSDGGYWYTTRHGNLNFQASNGTITPVKGSTGSNWIYVTTTGSSTQYKLLAVRQDGMLFSADQSRGLESEEVYPVESATVTDNGFYFARPNPSAGAPDWAGWIKGTAPKSWQKLYPING